MKKGFTLMEVLFVLLVIGLVLSFALPAFRAIRYDIQNSRAQDALKKLVEARRSFYQYNKGVDIQSCRTDSDAANCSFVGADAQTYAALNCENLSASGIPGVAIGASSVKQLFACQFLDWKDFKGIHYTFKICPIQTAGTSGCKVGYYAAAVGTNSSQVGAKYTTEAGYAMGIDRSMSIVEEEQEDD